MTKDMTTGNPVKLILIFSIPLLIGNIFQQFYSMVDTIIVGRFLGVKSLAAVGSTGSMSFLIIGAVLGLTSGFSVLVSQRFGANDEEGLKKAVGSSITLSLIMTILVTVVSLAITKPLLNIINTPSDIVDDSYTYISVIFGGTFAVFFYNMMASILRALGDSKTPLYFLIVASILNVILDIVFIVSFSMGVAGAAYATVVSQTISAILCLFYTYKKFPILRLNKEHFKFDIEYFKKHLAIGVPMALQFSITAVGAVILQGAVNNFGSIVVAAFTAALKVEQLVMQPSVTFGVTMATYAAQNLGAGSIERIQDGVKKCTIINIIIGIASGIILVVFGEYFVKLFVSHSNLQVIAYAKQYLTTVGFFFIPLSLIFVYRNSLQGMGYTFIPMMAGVGELLARLIVSFTLPSFIGYAGICLASPMAWIAACVPLILEFMRRIKLMTSEKETTTCCSTSISN